MGTSASHIYNCYDFWWFIILAGDLNFLKLTLSEDVMRLPDSGNYREFSTFVNTFDFKQNVTTLRQEQNIYDLLLCNVPNIL